MPKSPPSDRARAFLAWMKAHDTNTKQVSKRSGVSYTTLASFVQGDTRSLKGETEQHLASALDTTVEELFGGQLARMVRIIGRVGADADGEILLTTAHDTYDYAPAPAGGTIDAVAVEVVGHSMRGYADDGALIYFEYQHTPPTPEMIGFEAVVQTTDGRVLFKRLLRGSAPDLYDLESANGPTIRDVRLEWAAEVINIIPPRQAKRVILRNHEAA